MMAAATVDLPAIVLSGGSMLDTHSRGMLAGSGTVIWQCHEKCAAGEITRAELLQVALDSVPSVGHGNATGTTSTINALAEVLGTSLSGCTAIPAAYRERGQMAYRTGRRAVGIVREDLRPSQFLTRSAFLNAIRVNSALCGSTNDQPHLAAIAGAAGVQLYPEDWQVHGHDLPLLADVQPARRLLGESFHRAGGVPAVLHELLAAGKRDGACRIVTGQTVA